jgi:D-2-hydroxyacid dehydrogenase (NADP+)
MVGAHKRLLSEERHGGWMKVAYFNIYKDPADIRAAVTACPGVEFAAANSEAELPAALAGAEVIMVANRTYEVEAARLIREHGRELRWVAFMTSGIDKAIANGLPNGVTVTNMAGLRAFAVAEHAFYLMLGLMRASRASEKAQVASDWARIPLTPLMDNLTGKHLVIVGTGAIGQDIARKAKAFDMRVTGISRRTDPLDFFDALRPREDLATVVAEADILMVAALADDDTFGMISRDVIGAMQRHAHIVNIARGSLVDETALIEALKNGKLAGAGLDVQDQEPVPAGHPLWTMLS